MSSLERKGLERNPAGAASTASGAKTFIRIAACGQTIAHFPQSLQMEGSQIGISVAIARFSKRAVPEGKRPSAGIAETGSASPWSAISREVTSRTNREAPLKSRAAGTASIREPPAGAITLVSPASAESMAAMF